MPSIRPSRFLSRSMTASAIFGLRKVVAMNLPEPSGSSPPENPPGSMMICALRIAFSMRSIVVSMSAEHRLRTTRTSVSAPAFSNARTVSYSQFVPGNTGIKTRGFAALIAGACVLRAV